MAGTPTLLEPLLELLAVRPGEVIALPARLDLKLAPARPSDQARHGNQFAAHFVDWAKGWR